MLADSTIRFREDNSYSVLFVGDVVLKELYSMQHIRRYRILFLVRKYFLQLLHLHQSFTHLAPSPFLIKWPYFTAYSKLPQHYFSFFIKIVLKFKQQNKNSKFSYLFERFNKYSNYPQVEQNKND